MEFEEDEKMLALYKASLEWFVANFAEKTHGSLQILARTPDDEVQMIKIYANGDREMREKTQRETFRARARSLIGVGEGNLMGLDRPIPVVIMYYQSEGDAVVHVQATPYQWQADGRIAFAAWQSLPSLKESWTLSSP